MISADLQAQIMRFYQAEGWQIGEIARHLQLHHSTVKRVLEQLPSDQRAPEKKRKKLIDPFMPWLLDAVQKYPTLSARRLWEMARERGYPGRSDHFREIVATLRPPRRFKAYLRLTTLPGEQAQVDWGHFGTITVGNAQRKLSGFVMVLSYSRRPFVYFFYDQKLPSFLQGHAAGFEAFGGVPRVILYDNLKAVVTQRIGDAIRFQPELLEFSNYYKYEPRPVGVRRGNEKGRVERLIQYVRTSFFAAREFRDIDDLNTQAKSWCEGSACERKWPQDHSRTVAQAFREEQPKLLSLPPDRFAVQERVEVRIGKTPYARFDLNDYSLPHTHVQRTVTVFATAQNVRIFDGQTALASHVRCFDRGKQIEDSQHIDALLEQKHAARLHRNQNRLLCDVQNAQTLLEALTRAGYNLGSVTAALMRLLGQYGARALEEAIAQGLAAGAFHPRSIGGILEKMQREHNQIPVLPLTLPNKPYMNARVRPIR